MGGMRVVKLIDVPQAVKVCAAFCWSDREYNLPSVPTSAVRLPMITCRCNPPFQVVVEARLRSLVDPVNIAFTSQTVIPRPLLSVMESVHAAGAAAVYVAI